MPWGHSSGGLLLDHIPKYGNPTQAFLMRKINEVEFYSFVSVLIITYGIC